MMMLQSVQLTGTKLNFQFNFLINFGIFNKSDKCLFMQKAREIERNREYNEFLAANNAKPTAAGQRGAVNPDHQPVTSGGGLSGGASYFPDPDREHEVPFSACCIVSYDIFCPPPRPQILMDM